MESRNFFTNFAKIIIYRAREVIEIKKITLLLLLACCLPAASQEVRCTFPRSADIWWLKADTTLSPAARAMREDVSFLSGGRRGSRPTGSAGAQDAAFYIIRRMREAGLKNVAVSGFKASERTAHNITGLLGTGGRDCIVVMASYDGIGASGERKFPGADANASGVAALLRLAGNLKAADLGCDVIFAALDGHNEGRSGAEALYEELRGRKIRMVVNLDTIGSILAPPQKYWKNYLICLGGARYEKSILSCNSGLELHLYFDYYGSRSFTDLFYRKIGDQAPFVAAGVPAVMFTSGITGNTNKSSDVASTLNYGVLERRTELIRRWLTAEF